MDRRCAAGALLALAACIATTAAAPTASNQTALDLYEGPSEGCYYNFQHYGEGDRIMTNEPCLNCTCHNRMLMCYLRVCPFTKPIGQDCSVEKRADQCCPIVTCPDVPVDLLTSTSTSSPSEYGETGLGKLDRYGCSINGKYFPEGSKVPPSPNKPCEHCYCIRNMTTCVMQECTLHVDGCTPIYRKDVCCPVRYSCDHPEDEIPLLDDMTTTVRPTPGFLLTTTTLAPVTQMSQDCVHDDKIFADGALIKTEKACEHCYCMKGDIVCVVQECGTPMENEGKNCTSMPPREGQCCPDTYICEGDEVTTEPKPDTATVTPFEDISTLSPPRRVSVEGSGYRSETDEPSTEVTPLEPDTEGSGEEQPFKPTDANDMLIPERETSHPLIVTDQDDIPDHYSPSTTEMPESEPKITEKITTEADKGENTVPSGDFDDDSSDKPASEVETTTTMLEAEKESSYDAKTTVLPEHETFVKDKTTLHEEIAVTKPAIIAETTVADHGLHTSPEDQGAETTVPTRKHEDEEVMPKETTTLKHLEEATTQSSGIIATDTVATESTTSSFVEQGIITTISQSTEKDKKVKESTTESHVYLTTAFDINKAETQSATTLQPEIATELTTPSKGDISDTTSANPIENEIDEESFLTLAPGRIPGEGDCLLDGVTYSHESVVPSSSNCHTSCKCISSIVKCEPIVCSPAPDYMDNCQPMYDSPESCCPTYVCDHPRETVPPQSHSQMAGTESPIPTPTIECDGDQCQVVKEKEEPSIPCTSEGCADSSNNKPDECGPQGCGEAANKPEEARQPTEGCIGDSCSSSPEQCTSGKCEAAIPKDQTCNNENGCEIAVVQPCQGDDCAIQPEVTATKVDATTCDNPNGCEIPVVQTCQGDDCANQPDIPASKDSSTHCDDPGGCKNAPIPETAPDCKGESCISELPPKTVQDSQDCKNGNDCGQNIQTPSIEECNEEECKSQHVPEINKPSHGDCIGTKCTQQEDHILQITDVPQHATESGMRETELPEEPQTKSEEPVTDLPKTTAIEKEIEPSATTKASIADKEEETGNTPKYDEIDKIKEKEIPTIISESPETVTEATYGPQDSSITESGKTDTTIAPIQDVTKVKEPLSEVTPTLSEVPTTEIPEETESQESPMKPISDDHSEAPEDDAKDKNTFEITTTEAAIYSSSPKMTEEITEPPEIFTQAPETLDRDGHEKPTKEPEYEQDTEEKVTESTERYTSAPEQTTDKVDVEPTQEQEPESAPTTQKSNEIQTVVPEAQTILPQDEDNKTPEVPISTSIPEEPKTGKPDDIKHTSVDMTTPASAAEAETNAPQFVSEYTTSKPEIQLDVEAETQQPELNVTPGVESITKAPVSAITGETESQTDMPKPIVTSPHEPSIEDSDVDQNAETPPPVIVNVQTQTPMSIVKDHSDGEVESAATPEPAITTESITSESESLEPTAIPDKTQTKEPVSDIEKMPSVSDVEYTAPTTEPSADGLGTSAVTIDATKQAVDDSDKTHIPETETSTDSLPVSVPIVYEVSSESPVTEASLDEASAPQEETSKETKLPTSVTESSVRPTTEEGEIATSAHKQSDDKEDVTELPELIVHEHPTEPSSIEQESEQPANEETVTKEPQEFVPEKGTSDTPTPQDSVTVAIETPESVSEKEATGEPAQESATEAPEFSQSETTKPKPDDEISLIPESYATESHKEVTEGLGLQVTTHTPEPIEKETSDAPAPQDSVTVAIETPESISEKEPTGEPDQESATEAPEFSKSETTKSKPDDEISHIPESYATESQKEVTEGLGLQVTTNTPEHTATDAHKVDIDTPEIQATTASTVYEIAPQAAITESQPTVTETDVLVTEPHKDTTDVPISSDIVTDLSEPSDTTSDPHKESPALPEKPEITPYTETTKAQDITTTVPEVSPTELHKESTESPGSQDTATKVAEIPTDTSEKETTEESKPQDSVTIAPEVSAAEPQEETTTVPEVTGMAASEPETPEIVHKEQTTEAPVEKDVITSAPELIITETVPVEYTNIPMTEEKVTTIPEISVTEYPPIPQDSSSDVPEVYATESQKEVTEAPAAEDIVTNVPESHKDSQQPESQDTATSLPELADTDAKKDTNPPESQETSSTIPGTLETEPKKETTEAPKVQDVTDAPEISSNTKAPEKDEGSTGAQDMATNAPERPTVLDDELTKIQASSEKSVTEPINEPTESSEPLITESQKPATELPEILAAEITSPPEQLTTKSDKETTETPQQELTTKVSGLEKPEKDESVTEPPFKITTKLDDYTDSEPQEFVTPTAPPKIESEISLTTEGVSPTGPGTKVTESLATEYPIKITDTDVETESPAPSVTPAEEKPHEEQEIKTEIPYLEPAQTELPVTGSIEPDTKAPEVIDTESNTTATSELAETEKPDLKLTQPTTAPIEEDVTKAPEIVETQDKTTKLSEEPEQTTKEEYPETTPESVLLEEHTHKTISPDEETSVSPSDTPINEFESSTEVSIDRTTESTPSTESEKSPHEDVVSDKDHYVPEVTETTTSEKSTKPSPAFEETTTSSPSAVSLETEKPQIVESNEISTSAPTISEEPTETEKPLVPTVDSESDKELVSSEKPQQTIAPEDEFMIATTKATTIKADEEPTTLSPLLDKFGKPAEEEAQKPAAELEKPKPEVTEEISKPGANEVQPTEEAPEEEGHFPPSGTSGYGQEPDYGEEDSFGPGTCRYGGKVYVSAQQIPRDDPCDFCFCFRSDIICLQQSCPPPIHGCHEEPIQGFCCPRYECPVSMATTLNVTTTTTTTTTTLPPHFLPHAYKGAAQRRGCQIKGHTYKVGEVVRASSGPCLHCTCGGDGQMKCDPKVCTPEPMLRQMIAAAVSAKRRR